MKRLFIARPISFLTTTFMTFVLALTIVTSASAQTHYRIVDLTFAGGTKSLANGINDFGQVTGCSDGAQTGGKFHAFIYSNGRLRDIGVPAGADASCGNAINNRGHVAGEGESSANGSPVVVFLYHEGKISELNLPSGSVPTGVNVFDQVIGITLGNPLAFLYKNGSVSNVGTLPGDILSVANGINDRGEITGMSHTSTSGHFTDYHGFLLRQGIFTALGAFPTGDQSIGKAINNFGQIAGSANYKVFPNFSPIHAFLYFRGTLKDIGTLPGATMSDATAINERGEVVGNTDIGPFLFDGKRMIAANSLLPHNSGWTLNTANGINDRGEIIGNGTINGVSHGYVLTPIRNEGRRR